MKISTATEGDWLAKKLEFSERTVGHYALFYRYFVEFTNDVRTCHEYTNISLFADVLSI